MKPTVITKLNLAVAVAVLLAASTVFCQNTLPTPNRQVARPINMLVLGDSIIWGQGLKAEHKSWHQVKQWVETNTGRTVIEKIEAHSGAVIDPSSLTDNLTSTNPEVNVGLPTVNDEMDDAVRFYPDGAQVDLVLVSGCVNDVGSQNLLNASSSDEIYRLTEAKCNAPMESLLRRITTSFPTAVVIVTGYYPFFSEQTRNDFILKALTRRFFKTSLGAPKMTSKEVLERLMMNSREWFQTSNKALAEVVRRVNAELGGGRERVMFAGIEFPPDYSFAARRTRLWGFDRSPLRMALVLLSFGRIILPSNDEVRRQRTASCDEVYKRQPNETLVQKKERQNGHLLCRYAALAHPNREGALLYADAITNLLKPNLATIGSASR
jgi:lysophospholipase L1-like esterase